jgi:hypothetical protein
VSILLLALSFLAVAGFALFRATRAFGKRDRGLLWVAPAFVGAAVWIYLSTNGGSSPSFSVCLGSVFALYVFAWIARGSSPVVTRAVSAVWFLLFCGYLSRFQTRYWAAQEYSKTQQHESARKEFEGSSSSFVTAEIPGWILWQAIPNSVPDGDSESKRGGYELLYRAERPTEKRQALARAAAVVVPKPPWFDPPDRCIALLGESNFVPSEARCVADGDRWRLLRREGSETLTNFHVAIRKDLMIVTDDSFPAGASFLEFVRDSSAQEIEMIVEKNEGCISYCPE